MNNQSGIVPIAIILIIIGVLVLGGGYYAVKKFQKPAVQVCTQEAKQCPDGSYISRTGPNCEFAACPDITKDWKTYRDEKYGYQISYPKEYEYKDFTKIAVKSMEKSHSAFPLFNASFIAFGIDIKDDFLINQNNHGEGHKLQIKVYNGHIGVEDFFGSGDFNYKIGGLNAIKRETFEGRLELGLKRFEILFWKNSLTFLIAVPSKAFMNDSEMKIIDKMLSTFKFIR